jgi:hypothetical protein
MKKLTRGTIQRVIPNVFARRRNMFSSLGYRTGIIIPEEYCHIWDHLSSITLMFHLDRVGDINYFPFVFNKKEIT